MTQLCRVHKRADVNCEDLYEAFSLYQYDSIYKYDASKVQQLHAHINTKGQRMWNSGQCISMSSFVKSDNNWVEHFEFSRL